MEMDVKKNKPKTLREQIIERLNNGFGYNFSPDIKIRHHQGRKYKDVGGFSWYICDIRTQFEVGSSSTMSECLKWKKWVIESHNQEIHEYFENCMYEENDYIENEDNINFKKE